MPPRSKCLAAVRGSRRWRARVHTWSERRQDSQSAVAGWTQKERAAQAALAGLIRPPSQSVAGLSPVPEGRRRAETPPHLAPSGLPFRSGGPRAGSCIEALALYFGIDALLVFGESLDLLVHVLDALDKSTELIARYATWSAHTFLRVKLTAQRSRIDWPRSRRVSRRGDRSINAARLNVNLGRLTLGKAP